MEDPPPPPPPSAPTTLPDSGVPAEKPKAARRLGLALPKASTAAAPAPVQGTGEVPANGTGGRKRPPRDNSGSRATKKMAAAAARAATPHAPAAAAPPPPASVPSSSGPVPSPSAPAPPPPAPVPPSPASAPPPAEAEPTVYGDSMDDQTFLNFTCGTPVRVGVLDGTQVEQLDLEDEGFIDPTQGRRKGARGVNFTPKEDETLCRAWEEVSLDAITGNEQAGSTYWERIHDIFLASNTSGILRSQVSLTHRWSTISTECGEWSACVEQVERLNPSGANAQDKINIAQDLYKGKQKKKGGKGRKGVKAGKAFGLQHCWAILQHGEKWRTRGNEVPNKRQKSNNSTTSSYVDSDEDGDSSDDDGKRSPTPSSVAPAKKRPDGRKKEKDKLKKGGEVNYKESWDNMISTRKTLAVERMQLKTQEMEERKAADERKSAAEERRAAAEERKAATAEREAATAERKVAADEASKRFEQEQKLMFMDPNSLDEKGRAYFEMMRDQILASKMAMGGYGGFVGYVGGMSDNGNGGSNNDGNGSG